MKLDCLPLGKALPVRSQHERPLMVRARLANEQSTLSDPGQSLDQGRIAEHGLTPLDCRGTRSSSSLLPVRESPLPSLHSSARLSGSSPRLQQPNVRHRILEQRLDRLHRLDPVVTAVLEGAVIVAADA